MANLSEAPQSELFGIRQTPGAGRGVFARQAIAKGTAIHVADDLSAHVLFREYRNEVCWQCLWYDRGKRLPIRDPDHGLAFCSEDCQGRWIGRHDPDCLSVWRHLETQVKRSGSNTDEFADAVRPEPAEIESKWRTAAQAVQQLRGSPKRGLLKREKKELARLLAASVDAGLFSADVVSFQLNAVLSRHLDPAQWPATLALEEDTRPYSSTTDLERHIASYYFLSLMLPDELAQVASAEMLSTVKGREVRNSFGIRSLDDGGCEFFGWGVWPSASYFNHNCDPNTDKERVGRTWVFKAKRDISAGEEICISYLGRDMSILREERNALLKKTWGFECICQRCRGEDN
jgi:SET and MYND domain-containing protein